ncbi:MAG: tetratricopeptide repeat protein [Cyclobacteriaceae bacterium]
MRRLIALLVCVCEGLIAASQPSSVKDSIDFLLSKQPHDSALVVTLNDYAFDLLKSDPGQARDLAIKTSEIAREISFHTGYSRSLNVVGSSYWVTGDYEPALRYYQLSARYSEGIDDLNGLSAAYHNMGEVYKKVGNYKTAIEYLEKSLSFDSTNQANFALTLFNIGEVYLFLGEYPQSQEYFDHALKEAVPLNDQRTMAYVYQNRGKIKFLTNKYNEALPLYDKATELWKEQGDIRSLIQVYQDYSLVYLATGQLDEAEKIIDDGIALATDIQAMDLQVTNFDIESRIYKKKGDFKKSLEVLEKHNMLMDSVYNLKKSEQIALLQASFESDTREIENKKLRQDQAAKDARIRTQQFLILGISIVSVLAGLMAWISIRQHNKISEVNAILSEKNREIEDNHSQIEEQAQKLKVLNSKLSELNKTLESKIEVRTNQLKTQNHKLAEFAFMNAHQLRAPIARIMGLINLIQKTDLPEKDKVIVTYLAECGDELDQITKSISKNLEEDSVFTENLEE